MGLPREHQCMLYFPLSCCSLEGCMPWRVEVGLATGSPIPFIQQLLWNLTVLLLLLLLLMLLLLLFVNPVCQLSWTRETVGNLGACSPDGEWLQDKLQGRWCEKHNLIQPKSNDYCTCAQMWRSKGDQFSCELFSYFRLRRFHSYQEKLRSK